MLEYLAARQSFYPCYPQLELLDLRAEREVLLVYREVAHEFACLTEAETPVQHLTVDSLRTLLEDPAICSSYVLPVLLDRRTDPSDIERVLHRMRTWRDFDWGALEDVFLGVDDLTSRWYSVFRENRRTALLRKHWRAWQH
jgi:hypothetical protein